MVQNKPLQAPSHLKGYAAPQRLMSMRKIKTLNRKPQSEYTIRKQVVFIKNKSKRYLGCVTFCWSTTNSIFCVSSKLLISIYSFIPRQVRELLKNT